MKNCRELGLFNCACGKVGLWSFVIQSTLTAKEKNRGRSKSMIFDSAGKKITMKKLREQSFEEVKINCLEKKDIIKRGILTNESLKSAIAKGALTPITIRSNSYFNRQELAQFIKNNKT